jgi:sulfite oxidase
MFFGIFNIRHRLLFIGGGRKILRVDISPDGGKSWEQAELQDGSNQPLGRSYAWTFWSKRFKVPENTSTKQLEMCCKAVDESYNVQPDTIAPQWNLRGVLTNAWHRIKINVADTSAQQPSK